MRVLLLMDLAIMLLLKCLFLKKATCLSLMIRSILTILLLNGNHFWNFWINSTNQRSLRDGVLPLITHFLDKRARKVAILTLIRKRLAMRLTLFQEVDMDVLNISEFVVQ